VARIEMDHRMRQLVRFLDLDAGVQVGLEHRQALVDQLLHRALRQAGPWLELVDDDALDQQIRVVVGLDFLDAVEQAVQRAAREVVAVERDQAALRRDQRRPGVEVQRRRRVDPHRVVVAGQFDQRIAQLVDLVTALQLAVQFIERGARRHQVQVLPRRLDDEVGGVRCADAELQRRIEELGGARGRCVDSIADQVAARVGLPIEVDHQRALAPMGCDRRQIAGDGGLAHPALLVENDATHFTIPRQLVWSTIVRCNIGA
jgi:hypothetical protein